MSVRMQRQPPKCDDPEHFCPKIFAKVAQVGFSREIFANFGLNFGVMPAIFG
jgi:hypothetical protein